MAKRLDQLFTIPLKPDDTLESYRARWLTERIASEPAPDPVLTGGAAQRVRDVGAGLGEDTITGGGLGAQFRSAMQANPDLQAAVGSYPARLQQEFDSDILPRIEEIAQQQAVTETAPDREELHGVVRDIVKPLKGEDWQAFEERYSRVMVDVLKQAGLPHEGLSLDDLRPKQGTMRALGNSVTRATANFAQLVPTGLKMNAEVQGALAGATLPPIAEAFGRQDVADQLRAVIPAAVTQMQDGVHNLPYIGTRDLQAISDPALGVAAAEPRIPSTLGEIFSSPGNFGQWAQNEAIPIGATTAAIAGSTVLGGPAAGVGAAYGISAGFGYEEQAEAITQQLLDRGVSLEDAARQGRQEATAERMAAGVPMAALNYLPIPASGLAAKFGRGPLSRAGLGALGMGGAEAVTEASQSLVDYGVQQFGPTQPDITMGEALENAALEGVLGGITALATGGALSTRSMAQGQMDRRGEQPSPASPPVESRAKPAPAAVEAAVAADAAAIEQQLGRPATPTEMESLRKLHEGGGPQRLAPDTPAPQVPPQAAPAPQATPTGSVAERAVQAFTEAQRRVAGRVEGQGGLTPEQQAEAGRIAERAREFAGDAAAVEYDAMTAEQQQAVDLGLELGVQTVVVASPSGAEPVASGMMVEPGLVVVAPGQSPAMGLVLHETLHGLAENAQSRRAWQQLHDKIQNEHLAEYQAAAEQYRQRVEAAGMDGPSDAFRLQQEVVSLMAERNADLIAQAMRDPATVQKMADASPNFMRRWLDRIIGAARKVGFQPLARLQTWNERDAGQKTNAKMALDFASGLAQLRGPARAMVDPQAPAPAVQATPQPTVQPVAMTEQAAQQQPRVDPKPEPVARAEPVVEPTGVEPRPQVQRRDDPAREQRERAARMTEDEYIAAIRGRDDATEMKFSEALAAPYAQTTLVSRHKARNKGDRQQRSEVYEIRRDADGNLNAYRAESAFDGTASRTQYEPAGYAALQESDQTTIAAKDENARRFLHQAVRKAEPMRPAGGLTQVEETMAREFHRGLRKEMGITESAPQPSGDGVLFAEPGSAYGEAEANARRQALMDRPFNEVRSVASQMGVQASGTTKRQMVDRIMARHDPEGDGVAIPAPIAAAPKKKAKKKGPNLRDPKQRGFKAEDIGILGTVTPQSKKRKGEGVRKVSPTNYEPSTKAAVITVPASRASQVDLDADRFMTPSRWGEEIDAAADAYGYAMQYDPEIVGQIDEESTGRGSAKTEMTPRWVKTEKQLPTLYREHLQENPRISRIKSQFYNPDKGWLVPDSDYLLAVYGDQDAYAAFLDDYMTIQSGESKIDAQKLAWLRAMRDGGLDPDTQMLLYWMGKMELESDTGAVNEGGRAEFRRPEPAVMELVDPFALRMGTRFRVGTSEWAVVKGPDGAKWAVGDGLAYPAEAFKNGIPVTRGTVRGEARAKWEDMQPSDFMEESAIVDDLPFALNESVLRNLVRGDNVKSTAVKVGEAAISTGIRAAPPFVRAVHYFAGDATIGLVREVYRDVYNNQPKGVQRAMLKPDRFDQFTDTDLWTFTNMPIPASEMMRLSKTMARATVKSRMGRKDLAPPGTTPESGVVAKAFDQIMVDAMVNPDHVPDAEVLSRASKMAKDPGEESRIIAKVGRGELLDVFDAASAKMLYDGYASRYSTLNQQEITNLMALHQAWRYTGADTGRAMRIRRSLMEKTPEAATLDLLMDMLAQPVYGETKRLRLNRAKLAKPGLDASDRELAQRKIREDLDRGYDRFHNRTAPYLSRELAKRGLPPLDKLTLKDLNTLKVRDAIANAMGYGKLNTASNMVEMVQGLRVASMLSAPVTPMRNILGSAWMAPSRFAQKSIVAAFNDVFLRDPDLPSLREVGMGLNPMVFAKTLAEAVMDGAVYLKYPVRKYVPFGGELGVRDEIVTRRGIPGRTMKVVKALPNLTPAGDQVFNTFIIKMEARAQAHRSFMAAVKRGEIQNTPYLRSVWIESRANDPGSVEFLRASDEYKVAAFQDVSDFTGNIAKTADETMFSGVRVAQNYFAFANTLQRIISEIVKTTPPGAVAKVVANKFNPKVTKQQRAYDLARLPISFAMFAMLMGYAFEEDDEGRPKNFSGTAPKTREERAMMFASGRPPGAMRIPGTDKWVSMAGIAPIANVMALAADFASLAKQRERGERVISQMGPEALIAYGASYLGQSLSEHPFATGITEILRAYETGEWDGLGYNFAGTFVPNVIKRHQSEKDKFIRETRPLGEGVAERHDSHFHRFLYRINPSGENAVMQGILPKVDYQGREIERPRTEGKALNYLLHMASPFQQINQNANEIDLALWAYNTMHPNDPWFPGEVDVVKTARSKRDSTTVRMALTEQERYDIAKQQGTLFAELMGRRLENRGDEPLTPRDVHGPGGVSKLWSRAGRIAELRVLRGRMLKLQVEIPEATE